MHKHPLLVLDAVIRRGRRLVDRLCIPALNRVLRQRMERNPGDLAQAVDTSVARALKYFEILPGLEFTTLIILWPIYRAGLEPRLNFLDAALHFHRMRFNNPDLRLMDDSYDPEAPEAKALLYIPPNHPINVLMEKCIYADRLAVDESILDELSRLEDSGFYGTTHIVWGCLLLRRFSAIDQHRIDVVLDRALESMIRRQAIDGMGDLFAERIAFLQWANRHDDIDPAWLWRLLRAQRPDGGWRRLVSIWPQPSSQHTSCLALGVLLQFQAHVRGESVGDYRRR